MDKKWRSKQQAMNTRVQVWGCLKCSAFYHAKQSACLECHNQLFYFPSTAEFTRCRALQLQQRAGVISNLELQPKYPVVINGKKVFEYRGDFKYHKEGSTIVEDVKASLNPKYHDEVFKLKKKLVEALYGIKISIVI
jgi:hypothetical protein